MGNVQSKQIWAYDPNFTFDFSSYLRGVKDGLEDLRKAQLAKKLAEKQARDEANYRSQNRHWREFS